MSSFFFHSHGQPKWKVKSLDGPLSDTGDSYARSQKGTGSRRRCMVRGWTGGMPVGLLARVCDRVTSIGNLFIDYLPVFYR